MADNVAITKTPSGPVFAGPRGGGQGFLASDADGQLAIAAAGDGLWASCPMENFSNPNKAYYYFDDFLRWSEDEWTITVVSAGDGDSTVAATGLAGGQIRVDTATDENDGAQAQLDAISFALPAAGKLWFEARVEITEEVTQSDWFIGLLALDTTIIAGVPDNHVYFHKDDGDIKIDFANDKAGTPTANADVASCVVDTAVRLGFYWDGTTIYIYVNGVVVATSTTNIPTVAMSISFGYLNGAADAQNEGMNVDWIKCCVQTDRS